VAWIFLASGFGVGKEVADGLPPIDNCDYFFWKSRVKHPCMSVPKRSKDVQLWLILRQPIEIGFPTNGESLWG
jgi:hypothetical protein